MTWLIAYRTRRAGETTAQFRYAPLAPGRATDRRPTGHRGRAHLAEIGVRRFRDTISAARLKVSGIDLYSAGDFSGAGGGEALVLRDPRRSIYKRLVIREGRLCGALLYGDVRHSEWYLELMAAGQNVTPLRDHLLFGPPSKTGGHSVSTCN